MQKKDLRINWLNGYKPETNRIAILIPQYNEASRCNMHERLDYFRRLAEEYESGIDLILIDDGSTDQSLLQIGQFLTQYPRAFYVGAVSPNGNKVGALYMAALAIGHEFVVLTDFDTDLHQIGNLYRRLDVLDPASPIMGFYFRMLPYEGKGMVFRLQQLEYAFARVYYRFHRREEGVPVMPGAGSCYRRDVLLDIYRRHSGLRNGEDREATVIGLKMGFKALYVPEVLALTRPPLTFRGLLVQRRRWYLGYLETFVKEREFYFNEIRRRSRMGMRIVQDVLGVLLLLLLPLEAGVLLILNPPLFLIFLLTVYPLSVVYHLSLSILSSGEMQGVKGRGLIPLYPLFWVSAAFVSWWWAVIAYFWITVKNRRRKHLAGEEVTPGPKKEPSLTAIEQADI